MSSTKLKYDPECGFCGKFLSNFAGSMADMLNTCTCPILSSSSIDSINNDFSSSIFDLQQWDEPESFSHLHNHPHPLSYPQSSDNLSRTEYIPEYNMFDTSEVNGLVTYTDSEPYSLAAQVRDRMMMGASGPIPYDAGVYEAPASVRFDEEDRGCQACKQQLQRACSGQCCSMPGDTYDQTCEAQNEQDGTDNCIINCWYDKKNNSLICSYEPRDECDSDSDKSSESETFSTPREEFCPCTTDDDDDDDFPSGSFSLKLTPKDQDSTNTCSRFFGPSSSYLKRHRKAIDIGRRDAGQFKNKDPDECSLNISLYSAGGISCDSRQFGSPPPKTKKYHGESKRKKETKDKFINLVPSNDDSWLKRAKEAVARYVCEMETHLKKENKDNPTHKPERAKESPAKTEAKRATDSPCKDEGRRVKESPAKTETKRATDSPCKDEGRRVKESPAKSEAKRATDSPCKDEGRRAKESPAKIVIADDINVKFEIQTTEKLANIYIAQNEANERLEKREKEAQAKCMAINDEKERREREAREAIAKCIAENEENERREREAKEACVRRLMEIEENVRREKEAREAIARRLAESEENARKEREAKEALAKCIAESEENARREIQAKEMIARCIAINEENARKEREAKEALAKCIVENEENAKREQQAKEALARRLAEKEANESKGNEIKDVHVKCIAENEAKEKKEQQVTEAITMCIAENEENERREKQVKEAVAKCVAEKESKEAFVKCKEKKANEEIVECIAENLKNEGREEQCKIEEQREKIATTNNANEWCKQDNTSLTHKDSGKVKELSLFSLKVCGIEKKSKSERKPKCTGRICHSKVCSELCNLMSEKEPQRKGEKHDRLCKAGVSTEEKVKKRDRRCNHSSEYWAKENLTCNQEASPERTKNLQIKVSFKDCIVEPLPVKVVSSKCEFISCEQDSCKKSGKSCEQDLCKKSGKICEQDSCKKSGKICEQDSCKKSGKRSNFCQTSVCKLREAKRRAVARSKAKKCAARLADLEKCSDAKVCEFVCEPSKEDCGKLVCKSRNKPRPSTCCTPPKSCRGSRTSCTGGSSPDKSRRRSPKDPCDPSSCSPDKERRRSRQRSCSSSKCRRKLRKRSCSSPSCSAEKSQQRSRKKSCTPPGESPEKSRRRSRQRPCTSRSCSPDKSQRRRRQKSCTPPSCSLETFRQKSPQNSYAPSSGSPGRSRRRSRQKTCTPPSCGSSKSRRKSKSCTPSRSSIINRDPCFMMSFDSERTLLMPVKQCWSKRSSREIIEDAIRKLEDIEKKSLSGIVTPPRVCSEEPEFYDAVDSAHMNTSESNSREPSADAGRWCRRSNSVCSRNLTPPCTPPRGKKDSYEKKKDRCKTSKSPCTSPCRKRDSREKKRERYKNSTSPCASPCSKKDSYEIKRERCKNSIPPYSPPCGKRDSCEKKRERKERASTSSSTLPCSQKNSFEKMKRCKAEARRECRGKKCGRCKKRKKECACEGNSQSPSPSCC